jgi:hypothetical protein
LRAYPKRTVMIVSVFKKISTPFFFSILLMACAPSYYSAYYQLQEITPADKNMRSDELIYKDSVLKISYDFWTHQGKSTAVIENISNQLIYIDLELSHLIVNGTAYSYYTPRTVGISSSNSNGKLEQSIFNSRRYSSDISTHVYEETFQEQKYIVVPPLSRKTIAGYSISQVYKDCAFKKYPKNDSLMFSIKNTPFEFSNLIYYHKKELTSEPTAVKNSFWVSKINNIDYSHFVDMYYPKKCGVKSFSPMEYYPFQAKNRIYFKQNTL